VTGKLKTQLLIVIEELKVAWWQVAAQLRQNQPAVMISQATFAVPLPLWLQSWREIGPPWHHSKIYNTFHISQVNSLDRILFVE